MVEYDLRRLLEHPLYLRRFVPAAVVTFGGQQSGRFEIKVQWKRSLHDQVHNDNLVLIWDVEALASEIPQLQEEIEILKERDEDEAKRTEEAAVVVAVAIMSHIEPATRFTLRSRIGTGHDYGLNESRDEMIEIAGRRSAGLPGLFDEKRAQSDQNPKLKKRWVSVTIFEKTARNRTEGLHP